MIINGIKLNDVKVDKSEKTELSERDNKIIGWVSLALATLLLIAFFLGGFFSPVKASAGELVGGDVPIDSKYDNYLVLLSENGDNYILFCDNTIVGNTLHTSAFMYFYASSYANDKELYSAIADKLINGIPGKANSGNFTYPFSDYTIPVFSSDDIEWGSLSFQKTPCLIHKETTVGGLQAPEIATALTSQIVGLVPLVLGLLVLAIGLWKGLKHLRQTLSRA